MRLQGLLGQAPQSPVNGNMAAGPSEQLPDDASDQSDGDIDAYLCALAAAAAERTRPTGRDGCHRSAKGESSDPVPTAGPRAEAVIEGTPLVGRSGCHLADEEGGGTRALLIQDQQGRCSPTGPKEEDGGALLQDQKVRCSPTGPKLGVSSSGTGQLSSGAAGTLPGSHGKAGSSEAATAAGGGSSINVASSDVLGGFMVLSPADSSCYR